MSKKIFKSTCRMDHGGCGVLVHVEDGKAVKIEGNPDHPISKGTLCVKGRAAIDHLYHPDRLNFPLKRAGERGDGKWQRISWDEALDTIVSKFKHVKEKYGAEAIALGRGTERNNNFLVFRLQSIIGTPNVFGPGVECYVPKIRVSEITAGSLHEAAWFPRFNYPYDVLPQCLVAWGSRASITSDDSPHPCYIGFTKAIPKVKKLIVVDPRYTWEASKAHLWLQIRPGTDAALALGMLHVIINEGLYDREFVDKWTFGFDRLAERADEYPPEKVAEITWISADKIKEAARIYATSNPAVIHPGVAVEQLRSTTQTLRAIWCLIGITGNLDVSGGNVFCDKRVRAATSKLELKDRITPEVRKKRVTDDQYRVISSGMWPLVPALGLESIITGKPYPLRVLFFVAYNPMVAAANTRKVYEALKKVDFMAISELYMTPTAELADIVLPAKMWLERDEIQLQQADWGIPVRQNVVGQIEERRSDWEILIELANRMGEDSISSPRHYIDSVLKPHGVTFEELREKGFITFEPMKHKKYEEAGFATPSGKYELYSNVLEEMGYDPLPHHTEPAESPVSTPELTKEYPLVLTTGGRIPSFFHSEFRQIPKLRRQCPDPIVEIHPDTVKGLDIRDGDWVWIESPRGRVKQRAKLTSGIDPRVVHAQHAWWFPEDKSAEPSLHGVWESNINVLTDWHAVDEAMGSASFRALLCKVYKV